MNVVSKLMSRRQWLAIRDNGGSLQQFLRTRGRFVTLPRVKQGAGRNGTKRAARSAAKAVRS